MFLVKFHNSYEFEIDIKMYDESLNEEILKYRVQPKDEYLYEAHFSQQFFFENSDTKRRLRASANGITADGFEGCQFKAKEGRLLPVNITGGNRLFYFKHFRGRNIVNEYDI